MFDNPYFRYAGVNNMQGAMPYIVNLSNTNSTDVEVNLFNAQENQTAENRGLPEGVVANAEAIFEMTKSEIFFSCYQTAPFNGFREKTLFQLVQDNAPNPDIITDMFQLKESVLLDTAKILGGGYDGNTTLTQLFVNSGRLNVSASAEGLQNVLRFIFSVTSMVNIKNRDIKAVRVVNTTTYPCLDEFPLTRINTGFNSSDSGNAASYEEILATTNFSPLGVDHILIQSENIQRIAEFPITLSRRDATGNVDSKQIALSNSPYIRPNQRTIQAVNKLDGATALTFTIPPETAVSLFIYENTRMVL
jgi:hypothetical protein